MQPLVSATALGLASTTSQMQYTSGDMIYQYLDTKH